MSRICAVGVLIFACLPACAMVPGRPVYEMPLEAVRRPADVASRWGDYRITPADSSGFRYEDELIDIVVVPTIGAFALAIENRTEHSIQLVWTEAAFVGADGLASRVVPGTTRVIDMEREQPPTVIPARARVSVSAIPNEYYVDTGVTRYMRDFVCLDRPYEELEGKETRLILPFRVQDVTNEYTFVFRIGEITAPAASRGAYIDRSERCIR